MSPKYQAYTHKKYTQKNIKTNNSIVCEGWKESSMGTMLALYTTNQGSISGTLKEPSNLAKTVSVSNARSKA